MTVATSAAPQLKADASVLGYLQGGIRELLEEIQGAAFWHTVTSPHTEPALLKEIMKQVYLEIHWYQPDVIEATIAAIGQFPRSMPAKRIRTMLIHQADEWDHGEMALKDFVGLGGSESAARSSRMSPTAFITAAFWRMLAHTRDPFAYLGALYLFEGLTPLVTGLVKGNLEAKGLREDALGYIEFHSTEDIKHARVVDHLVSEVTRAYPESADAIRFGFDTFRRVYPLPGWWAAYQRGLAEYEGVETLTPSGG